MMQWFIVVICLLQAAGSSDELTESKEVNLEDHMNVSHLICHKGYSVEEYEVLTDDGYYLTLYRIPHGRKRNTVKGPKPVVFLQHGILGQAVSWVENTANYSFGFILADSGYDVWLGNNRGTRYCQKHQNFSVDQEEFWDFSFHEMAMYDLPAMINFVLQKTEQKQLYYVGYSQGTTLGFIAFSSLPELSQKIRMFFALAPVISIRHSQSPMIRLLTLIPQHPKKGIFPGKNFILSRKPIGYFTNMLCRNALKDFCERFVFSLSGFNATNVNMSRMSVYAAHYPDQTSYKNILHWKQTQTGLFRYFDYGNENQAKYNQNDPKPYKVEDMIVPTAVWNGGNDLIANPTDTEILLHRITNLVFHQSFPDWNHWDFIWGFNAPKRMYFKILELMKKSL